MATQTIEVSESAYHMLLIQADRLQISPGRLVEYLAESAPLFLAWEEETNLKTVHDATDAVDGLAALERLTTLFADLSLADIEAHLANLNSTTTPSKPTPPFTPVKLDGLWQDATIEDEDIAAVRHAMWAGFGDAAHE
ncbi:MAG: hypothetical protein R3A44_32445 [Caldilineaceae bacterium]